MNKIFKNVSENTIPIQKFQNLWANKSPWVRLSRKQTARLTKPIDTELVHVDVKIACLYFNPEFIEILIKQFWFNQRK